MGLMYTILMCLSIMAQPPAGGGGIAFFKVVNTSSTPLEIEITGTDFVQIVTIKPGKDHLIAVKEGRYNCGVKSGDKQSCTISAGQILQLDLPWAKTALAKKDPEPKEPLPKKSPDPPKDDPPLKKPKDPPRIFESRDGPDGKKIEIEVTKDTPKEKPEKKPDPPKEPTLEATKGMVEVNGIPDDGFIAFDGVKAKNVKQRWFKTPDLNPNGTYFYILTATVERNGSTYIDTRKVIVRAGHKTVVNFNLPK